VEVQHGIQVIEHVRVTLAHGLDGQELVIQD
jgi:hypothetical protein